jgi:stearoyl-CoA desaturase (delta-9 desaturase)
VFPIGLLIGGEELHNNHHAFASSAKLSSKWYEFDVGWMYIRILSMFGLATVRRLAPKPRFAAAKPVIDFDTLQAVIAHRYDMMAAFADSLRVACSQEARRLGVASKREGAALNAARHWLVVDAGKWSAEQKARVGEVFAASDSVRKLVEMRQELAAIWERSNLNREQLLAQLQQWLARAESSGMRPLQDLALRVRSYAA